MQAIAGPESAFDAPFVPYSFFASLLPRTGWVGGAPKLSLPPGAGNPRYATDQQPPKSATVYDSLLGKIPFNRQCFCFEIFSTKKGRRFCFTGIFAYGDYLCKPSRAIGFGSENLCVIIKFSFSE